MEQPEWGRFEKWRARHQPFAERLASARAEKAAERLDLAPLDAKDLRLDLRQSILLHLFTVLDAQPEATDSYCRTAMCWAADKFLNRTYLDAPLDTAGTAMETRIEAYAD